MSIDKTLKLRDGRTLAYTEHGDLDGTPVFFIHGNPGSRYMRHPDEHITETLGVRVITPDRPGYGRSDFQPKRTLLDMPDDIAQLADSLDIDKFAMFGVSAGGPYVAACAYKMPERMTGAAMVSSPTPYDRPGFFEEMNSDFQWAFKLARLPGGLLRLMIYLQTRSLRNDPEKVWEKVLERVSEADKHLLRQPDCKKMVQSLRPEAVHQGSRGMVQESKILIAPWGFELSEIKIPIHLWYWSDDHTIPLQMGMYLDEHLPHSISHFHTGGGHFSLFSHWHDILALLLETEEKMPAFKRQ